jgi:replicative DNA helicase
MSDDWNQSGGGGDDWGRGADDGDGFSSRPDSTEWNSTSVDGNPRPPEKALANVEAEAALLGALMIDNRVLGNVQHLLTGGDFFEPLHGRIYETILKILSEGGHATPVTLKPYFELDPSMTELGGVQYLAGLTGSGAGLIGAASFAVQIRDLSDLRKMTVVLEEGIAQARNTAEEISPAAVMEAVTSGLAIAGERHERAPVRSAADMIKISRKRIREIRAGASMGAICRSIADINDVLGPLAPKTLTVIGGRPSMGKSVLAQSLAWGYAANDNPTALISLEMAEEALANRLTADLTHALNDPVPLKLIQNGKTTNDHDAVIDAAALIMENMPLDVMSPDRSTIEAVEAMVAKLVDKWKRKGKPLKVLILDYLQIIGTSRRFKDGRERVDYISERCLGMAKRYGLAVIVLSQLSRAVEQRPDSRPQLSDLKESGRIEEDADNVVLVYRAEYYLERDKKQEGDKGYDDWLIEYERSRGRVDLIAAKVRQGEVGVRRVKWFGASQAIRGSAWEAPFMDSRNDLIPEAWLKAA